MTFASFEMSHLDTNVFRREKTGKMKDRGEKLRRGRGAAVMRAST